MHNLPVMVILCQISRAIGFKADRRPLHEAMHKVSYQREVVTYPHTSTISSAVAGIEGCNDPKSYLENILGLIKELAHEP